MTDEQQEQRPAISIPPTRVTRVSFQTNSGGLIEYAEMPGINASILLSYDGHVQELSYECWDIERARNMLNMLVQMSEARISV